MCLAGVDSGKLRAALRNIGGAGGGGARATSAAAPRPAPPAPAPVARDEVPLARDVSATAASTKPAVGATIEALFEERMAKLRLMKQQRENERTMLAPDAPDAPDDE